MEHDPARIRSAIEDCQEMADLATAGEYKRYWAGGLDPCDHCGADITPDLAYFCEGEICPDEAAWGFLCPVCLTYGGNEMVWGKGQLYQYQPSERAWLMVAGFPPRHLWTTSS